MMRSWLAVALLAGSWLLGLSFYTTASIPAWIGAALVGAGLMAGVPIDLPARRPMLASLALVALPAWLMPWPYRAAPLLMGAGLAVALAPQARSWLGGVSRGLVAAGAVLLAQAVTFLAYAGATARSRDLPGPLVELLAALTRLLGADAAASGSEVVLRSFRQVHRLAATWDLLVDPASLAFLAGGGMLVGLVAASSGASLRDGLRTAATLALVVVAWLPLRAAVLIGVFIDRDQRFIAATPPHVMNHFFSPWVQLALLAVLALAVARLVRMPAVAEEPRPAADRAPLAVALAALAAALVTIAICWDPPGRIKAGRVAFVERHSEWEPSTRPYDTSWYGEASAYNYAALYDYCGRFFEMSHVLESEPIDDRRLASCDVLVIKTPTEPYEPREIAAILRFVQRGGGLLLVGEHTNYSLTSSHLNAITRPLGFTFRHDLLFGPDVAYDQLYRRPAVPHPAVARVPPTDFAVSCSIEPGSSAGRSVICSTGLWSLPPDYNSENFFPVPRHDAAMRYGAFVEAWAVRHGQGRVLAFGDSTIFSNFSLFEPGKLDLMMGMLAWLNRTNTLGDPRDVLLALALLPFGAAVWLLRRGRPPLVPLASAMLCAVVLTGQAVAAVHRWSLPAPPQVRPMTRVIVDRTLSRVPLAKGGFPDLSGQGYGLAEQWIGRLGVFPSRAEGRAVFSGDALLVICPSRSVPDWYRQQLVEYVERGGKLFVLDSPENAASTANSLLWPFKLSLHHDRSWRGQLIVGAGKPELEVQRAWELSGGETVARIVDHPVAVTTRHGRGTVLAVGCASLWNDASMGGFWNVEPDATQRARYELFFRLMRELIGPGQTAAKESSR